MRFPSIAVVTVLSVVSGCSAGPSDEPNVVADVSAKDAGASYPASAPMGPCNAVVQQHPIEGYVHVPVCSAVAYKTKPPSSGNHYPIWAAYETYSEAIPEGFWVHDLEHGGIVVTYNCPGLCASDIEAAEAWVGALPDDPLCDGAGGDDEADAGAPAGMETLSDGNTRVRVTLTPDPQLDVAFAASAWGWTLRADCFDPVAFGQFLQEHYGHGRETICSQGLDLSTGVESGCGE